MDVVSPLYLCRSLWMISRRVDPANLCIFVTLWLQLRNKHLKCLLVSLIIASLTSSLYCTYTYCRYTCCRYTYCRYTYCRYTCCRYNYCRYTCPHLTVGIPWANSFSILQHIEASKLCKFSIGIFREDRKGFIVLLPQIDFPAVK